MLSTLLHRHCLVSAFPTLRNRSRCISSLSHLTKAEQFIYIWRSINHQLPSRKTVPQQTPRAPQFLQPQIYCSASSSWVGLENGFQEVLERDRILKAVTWNIDHSNPGPEERAVAALEHLQALLGQTGNSFVIMLQEVCRESLQEILNCPWVQRNFVLSHVAPPESLYINTAGESFILKELDWKAASYFTLMMVSKELPIKGCFRVPFDSTMGRDVLGIDIPVSSTEEKECLRLCTTHLESCDEQRIRASQLSLISKLLKGTPHMDSRVIGGLVGGDMNALERSEDEIHKTTDVDLNDAWEDGPTPPMPILKPFLKDFSYGRARGITWGYQSGDRRTLKRLDKFFYTGSIETVLPSEAQDLTGRLGRLGINLETDVSDWVQEYVTFPFVRGHFVKKWVRKRYSNKLAASLREKGLGKGLMHMKRDCWVSDHFGLIVGIKVV